VLSKPVARAGICDFTSGYVGDRNLRCISMSIRLAGFYCAVSETLTCRLGRQLKI